MNVEEIDRYLARLRVELRKRGLHDDRSVEEARGHLADAVAQGLQRGLSPDAAQSEAIARFGPADSVAATFASERYRRVDQLLFAGAILIGLAIAYVDSRPNWDDTGVIAFTMVVAAGAFGLLAPRRPWLWALAIGIWIPLSAIARKPSPGSVAMLIVLAFPFAGACAGMALRRAHAMLPRLSGSRDDRAAHDQPNQPDSIHFALKSRRGWINPELAAIVADPASKLVPFLERSAPAPFGPLGTPHAVTIVDDGGGSATRTRRYRVVFGEGERSITCNVEVGATGKRVSVHWSR